MFFLPQHVKSDIYKLTRFFSPNPLIVRQFRLFSLHTRASIFVFYQYSLFNFFPSHSTTTVKSQKLFKTRDMTIIFPYFTCLKLFAICCCITDKSKYQGMKGSFFSVPTSPNSSIGHSPPAFRSSPIGIHTTYNSPDTECYFLSLSLHCLFYLECPLPMMINLVNSSVSYKTQLREPFCDTPHKYN